MQTTREPQTAAERELLKLAQGEAEKFNSIPSVQNMKMRDLVYSPNYGAELVVVQVSYGVVPTEDVLSGKAKPVLAYLSADGRAFDHTHWHRGPESGESIYVEVHDYSGRFFHGWVDARSRRIVQTG